MSFLPPAAATSFLPAYLPSAYTGSPPQFRNVYPDLVDERLSLPYQLSYFQWVGRQCCVCLPNMPSMPPDLRFWITGKIGRWRYCRVKPLLQDMYKRCSYEIPYIFEYIVYMFHFICVIIFIPFYSIPKVLFRQNNMNLKSIIKSFCNCVTNSLDLFLKKFL